MSEHELWNELGNLYFLSGSYPQAVHAYNRSIHLDEGFGRPYSNLALTYVQQGRFDEAVDLYRRSIELLAENKEKAISWNRLGNVYRYLKDYQQAVVAYRRADELDPDNGEAHDQPGWTSDPDQRARATDQGRAEPAKKVESHTEDHAIGAVMTEEARPAEDPTGMSTVTWNLAQATAYQQDVSESLEPGSLTSWGEPEIDTDWPLDPETEVGFPDVEGDNLTKWLPVPEQDPVDVLEYSLDESALAEAEEPPSDELSVERLDAIGESDLQATAQGPAQADTQLGVSIAALPSPRSSSQIDSERSTQGTQHVEMDIIVAEREATEYVVAADTEEPRANYETAPIDDGQPPAAFNAASEETTAGPANIAGPERDAEDVREIEAGIAKFKRVVQLNPRNAHAWDALGNLYKSAGSYKEALMAYEQAISNDPSKAMYHHHLGLVYAHEGRTEDAIDALQRVLEIEPDHSLAHATLGGYYRKMGLEELAQKHVGKVMKSIFDSENEYNRACLAAICGNTDQALELLGVALKNKQTYVDWILRDPDLDFIRQDPRFKQLISDYAS
jgi:tetratricopeptide (TPR) repeat protein